MHNTAYFIGIDVGTQGARSVLIDQQGNLIAGSEEAFPLNLASREEQSPQGWWEACFRTLEELLYQARKSIDLKLVKAASVTSTSGTVIPLDKANHPLHAALMYSDKRSEKEAFICRDVAKEALQESNPSRFTGFNSSCALPKILWFNRAFPDKVVQIARWVHAADYISGCLSGIWGLSDFTNVLKTGADLQTGTWPSYIPERLQIRREWLPSIVASGTPLGRIRASLAASLGLPEELTITAGMTDGCASQVASGAMEPGRWNTTIGTTLVIKGVTRTALNDKQGRFYSHRHPEGYWMPGGASNTGADWVREFGPPEALPALDKQAGTRIPGGELAWPLRQKGERFPFIAPEAQGFGPEGLDQAGSFLANMEGVAYLERYAYELAQQLSGESIRRVYSAGGGSKNDTWLKIRSNVLNVPVCRMEQISGASGAAILAASQTHFSGLGEATRAMTRVSYECRPDPRLVAAYAQYYQQFLDLMRRKGFINSPTDHA